MTSPWTATGPSTITFSGRTVRIGRPPGSNHFTEYEAKQRHRAAARKWWNEVGKARRAQRRKEASACQ